MFKIRFTILVCFVAIFFFNGAGFANPLELYGLSSRSMGMNQAATASARDYSALFYNPGRLGFVAPSVGAHFTFSFDNVKINMSERKTSLNGEGQSYVVPDPGGSASVLTMPTNELSPRSDTTNDPNAILLSAGVVHDFGLYWLRVGAAVSVPLTYIANADIRYADEREQYFTNKLYYQLLNRRAIRPSFLAGVAFRPIKWLSFGATVNVFGNIVANTKMFIPDAAQLNEVKMTMDVKMKYDAAVIVGIQIDPVDWFGFGISFRDRSWFGAGLVNNLQLNTGAGSKEVQEFNYGFSFSPRTLSAGARFDVGSFTISADAGWMRWSEFKPETDLLVYNDETGEDETSYSSGFDDTYFVRAGIEYRATKWMDVRAGAGWQPSPVPEQTGRTNFVDNDKVEASVGLSFYLPWVKGLSVDVHAQFITLLKRTHVKDESLLLDEFPEATDIKTGEVIEESKGLQTNNPGWPRYSSSGYIGSAGVGVSYQFQ